MCGLIANHLTENECWALFSRIFLDFYTKCYLSKICKHPREEIRVSSHNFWWISCQTRYSIVLTLSFSLRTKVSPPVLHFSVLTQLQILFFLFCCSDREVHSNTRNKHSRRGEGQHLAASTYLGEHWSLLAPSPLPVP